MVISCALCDSPATMFCDSDQASLCWACDTKVHGANFLVARHTRKLLCQRCQCPTPWSATGPKLCQIMADCNKCLEVNVMDDDRENDEEEVEVDIDTDIDLDDSSDDDDELLEEGEEEEEGENQVVPLSPSPPPLVGVLSSAEGQEMDCCQSSLKRSRGCSSPGVRIDQENAGRRTYGWDDSGRCIRQ